MNTHPRTNDTPVEADSSDKSINARMRRLRAMHLLRSWLGACSKPLTILENSRMQGQAEFEKSIQTSYEAYRAMIEDVKETGLHHNGNALVESHLVLNLLLRRCLERDGIDPADTNKVRALTAHADRNPEIDTHNLEANLFDMKLLGESYSQLAYRVAHADLIASNTHSTIVEPGTEAQPQFAMVSSGQFVSAKLPATPW